MSIASEITRLQNAKSALKTSINAKTDSSHQIDDETLDEYSDFVDSIQTGGGGGSVDNDIFVITGTYNSGTYTIDKTYQEINEAYEQNKILLLVLDEYTIFLSHVYNAGSSTPEYMFQGHGIIVFNNKLYSDTINIKRVEGFTMTTEEYNLTPAS